MFNFLVIFFDIGGSVIFYFSEIKYFLL